MSINQLFGRGKRRLVLSSLALSGVVAIAGGMVGSILSAPSQAQTTTPGLNIFGGLDSEYRLRYRLDNNSPRSRNARYYLNVSRNRVPSPVSEIEISYPAEFTDQLGGGRFSPEDIEVRLGTGRGGERVPLSEVIWLEEENRIEIYPEAEIPADTDFVVVMNNVRNPSRFGFHNFNLRMLTRTSRVGRQYVGTWQLRVSDR